MVIQYIRHGLTEANETTGICGCQIDWPLSKGGRIGIQQLVQKGIYPSETGACYTSCLNRTQQTFRIIYPDKPYEPVSLLNERNLGIIEFETNMSIILERRKHLHNEEGIENPLAYIGGEDFDAFTKRVYRDFNALLELAYSRGQDLITIVGHGSYLRQIGTAFSVPGFMNDISIAKNGTGFIYKADRRGPSDFSLLVTGFIGGKTKEELLGAW